MVDDMFHDMFVYFSLLLRRVHDTKNENTICFAICLCTGISPDFDRHRAPKMKHTLFVSRYACVLL